MEVNKIINQRRLELGLTLKDVAKALGVAESTVSRYESLDIKHMGIDKIEALAKVLDCTPAYLMGWEEADYSEDNGAFLGTVLQNKAFLNAMKKAWAMPESKKETLYSYIDFLCATNQR